MGEGALRKITGAPPAPLSHRVGEGSGVRAETLTRSQALPGNEEKPMESFDFQGIPQMFYMDNGPIIKS